jgi:hypothetical protein
MERQGRLMSIKEQVLREQYEVDADAVAQAIIRRLTAATRRASRSDDVLVAVNAPRGRAGQAHA